MGALGHEAHYLCFDQMREAIEDTGAIFHSAIEHEPELYSGRDADLPGAMTALVKEHGLESDCFYAGFLKLRNVQLELQLPGILRFFRSVKPDAVIYCAIVSREASFAAKILGIPRVGLYTNAGPGSRREIGEKFLAEQNLTLEDMSSILQGYEPNVSAVRRLNAEYALALETGLRKPFGMMDMLSNSICLVTTSEDLQDPITSELAHAYHADGARFVAVGPLLDCEGAFRAGGQSSHRTDRPAPRAGANVTSSAFGSDLVVRVRAARAMGRRVVLVSMGTVITSNHPKLGWEGRALGANGLPRGLGGRELCHAAWSGTFDAFGADSADEGALVLVALGTHPDPLGNIKVPPNAICLPSLPQVDILKAGVDLFLTHGGQNSFTESLAYATPVVVCPGFGDQILNSNKAVALGVGLKVDRPDPDVGGEIEAAALYRKDVSSALVKVLPESGFGAAASRCAKRLQNAGGVPRAVELVMGAALGASRQAGFAGA